MEKTDDVNNGELKNFKFSYYSLKKICNSVLADHQTPLMKWKGGNY